MKYISIVGSAEPGRTYDPPIRNAAEAKKAAELLGSELAKQGYGLNVYAAGYIESDVVRGFVKHAKTNKSICVHYPFNLPGPEKFPEYTTHKALFETQVDESTDWEVSFYQSLSRADGMVLIGGSRSSLIAGVLALAYRIPIISLQHYGGSGEKIWKAMSHGRGIASKEEANIMAQRGDPEVVREWVGLLESQTQARYKEAEVKSGSRWAFIAALLAVTWMLALPIGYNFPKSNYFIYLLFLAPMAAGASGATVRMLLPDGGTPTARTTALGMTAGGIAGVLYVISHLLGKTEPGFPLLVIAVIFGFIAGLGFDVVFKKLQTVDVLRTDVLKKT